MVDRSISKMVLGAVSLMLGTSPGMASDQPPDVLPVIRPPRVVCTLIYRPVCGSKGGTRMTFGNNCVALVQGATRLTRGPCQGTGSLPISPERL